MHQIRGSVHRIQDPDKTGKVDLVVVLLLSHELNVRIFGAQLLLQISLHMKVHFCHKIDRALGVDVAFELVVVKELLRGNHQFRNVVKRNIGTSGH